MSDELTGAEAALYEILRMDAGVAALVGGSSSPRIFPNRTPQDVDAPAVSYFRVSTRPLTTHGSPATLRRPRMQVMSQARRYADAKRLAGAVAGALYGYMGTAGGVKVQAILLDDEADEYGAGEDVHVVTQEWLVWVNE